MGNHRDYIKNETAYFRKVVKNMDAKQDFKNSQVDNNETLTEDIENLCFSEDKYFCENDLLDWIEMIENVDLHRAIKNLSLEEQTLLSYIFFKEKTQSEVAKIYNVTHQNISYKIDKIIYKIKKYIFKK